LDGEFDAPGGEPVFQEPLPAAGRLRDRLQFGVLAAVAVGGAAGGLARAGIQEGLVVQPGHFPWAVFIINVTGALLIGGLLAFTPLIPPGRARLRALLVTGFCGGFTTWSTFMVGVNQLLARGCIGIAFGYLAASLVAGLAAAVLGAAIVEQAVAARRRAAS
jgi:fluoride exporter